MIYTTYKTNMLLNKLNSTYKVTHITGNTAKGIPSAARVDIVDITTDEIYLTGMTNETDDQSLSAYIEQLVLDAETKDKPLTEAQKATKQQIQNKVDVELQQKNAEIKALQDRLAEMAKKVPAKV
jgi:hypothetical protein